MIMKFDHIAFSCSRAEIDDKLKRFASYNPVFYEKNLPNIEAKKDLLTYNTIKHDIVFLEHTKEGVSVEITAYDKLAGNGKYDLDEQTVTALTYSLEESIKFYVAVGFKPLNDYILIIQTLMDKTEIRLKLLRNRCIANYALDNHGFCALAFITNNAMREKKRLNAKNVKTTSINQLSVNGKDLNIFFAYNECGDIVEFIEPCSRKVP